VRIGDQLVHLDATPRAFGIDEVQLHHRYRVEGGEKVRTGDRGVPVVAKALGIAEVRIFRQCQCSAESEGD
jgi:hypothetical protein